MESRVQYHVHPGGDPVARQFFDHSSGLRTNTDAVIARALNEKYPGLVLSIAPQAGCSLTGLAAAGHATLTPIEDSGGYLPSSLAWKSYIPPERRIDGSPGGLLREVMFGKFLCRWDGDDFIVYLVDGRDGSSSYPHVTNQYILSADQARADALIFEAGKWADELHGEVWVFDGGLWQKRTELFQSVIKASWDSVILDGAMKKAIIEDHLSFFQSRETYDRLAVPWKRGVIYYGPPGNGKTISIKATMHMLYNLPQSVPTLYVRTLASYGGPEYSIKQIFLKARQVAPCYLVFEDLDTIVSDYVRSYFLNEVDGVKSNDGIFMIGSTNHLDRLDPGISKRPSRFDRKYLFPDPDFDQRVAYCHFWQSKLADNKDVEFPDMLCGAVADITDKFSFAYMQEAFVAALLSIARSGDAASTAGNKRRYSADSVPGDDWVEVPVPSGDGDGDDGKLEKLVLWREIKKQVEILREGMEATEKRP